MWPIRDKRCFGAVAEQFSLSTGSDIVWVGGIYMETYVQFGDVFTICFFGPDVSSVPSASFSQLCFIMCL